MRRSKKLTPSYAHSGEADHQSERSDAVLDPPRGRAPPFSFAGLWEAWGEGGSRMETFTVLTCPAGEALAPVYARQPVVLAPEEYGA